MDRGVNALCIFGRTGCKYWRHRWRSDRFHYFYTDSCVLDHPMQEIISRLILNYYFSRYTIMQYDNMPDGIIKPETQRNQRGNTGLY